MIHWEVPISWCIGSSGWQEVISHDMTFLQPWDAGGIIKCIVWFMPKLMTSSSSDWSISEILVTVDLASTNDKILQLITGEIIALNKFQPVVQQQREPPQQQQSAPTRPIQTANATSHQATPTSVPVSTPPSNTGAVLPPVSWMFIWLCSLLGSIDRNYSNSG